MDDTIFPEDECRVRKLFSRLIAGWNHCAAEKMANPFTEDEEQIGFDGSQITVTKWVKLRVQRKKAD